MSLVEEFDQNRCEVCKYPIMYWSPDYFDPINIDEVTGKEYCDECYEGDEE